MAAEEHSDATPPFQRPPSDWREWETQIPAEMIAAPRWVVWKWAKRKGKLTKVPFTPLTMNSEAKSNDPATWRPFQAAYQAAILSNYAHGLGFMLGDGWAGVDFDHVRDSQTGKITDEALRCITALDSYGEVSPSGTGAHVIIRVQDAMPDGKHGHNQGGIEAYTAGRYFTVTGQHLEGTPATVNERTAELAALWRDVFMAGKDPSERQPRAQRAAPAGAIPADDEALLERARNAENGARFRALFDHGDTSAYGSDHSRADSALLQMLAFWTADDAARIDRLFRRSALMRDEKWDRSTWSGGQTYGAGSIEKIIQLPHDTYSGPTPRRGAVKPADALEDAGADVTEAATRTPAPRREIVINGRHLRELTADTVDVLAEANATPVLFQRSGQLVRMRVHEDGRPVLEAHSEHTLRERAAKVADWVKASARGDDEARIVPSGPPVEVIRNVMAAEAWPFPAVTSITQAPALRPDGSILSQPGYDAATRLVYAPASGLRVPAIPERPTQAEARAALAILDDVLADFPFDSAASRAHAFALMLTAITRPAIAGPVPMAIITAPAAGTGKGLLADVVAIIATGSEQQAISAPDKESEWRDSIFSALRDGPVFVMLDNLRGALSAPALEAALTASSYKQRVKGFSVDEVVPQRAVWVATGNNLQLAGDMPRRCYRIRLDAETARPERRQTFRHAHLRAYVRTHRGKLLAALLTLARTWWADGCPTYEIPAMGSFEEWARVVGSILAHAGVAGFLSNFDEMYAEADPERPQWAAFFTAWRATYGDAAKTVAAIAHDIAGDADEVKPEHQALRDAVPDALAADLASAGKFTRRLGYTLRPQVDRRYETDGGGEVWIAHGGQDGHSKAILWRVRVKPGAPRPPHAGDEPQNGKVSPASQILNNSGFADGMRVMAGDEHTTGYSSEKPDETSPSVYNARATYTYHPPSPADTASSLMDSGRTHAGDGLQIPAHHPQIASGRPCLRCGQPLRAHPNGGYQPCEQCAVR